MTIIRTLVFSICLSAAAAYAAGPAMAQACTKQGVDVSCDDGRRGGFTGDAIIWADGTRSSLASPHPSVIVGHKQSVVVGQGVFVGQGKGLVPMENPRDPRRARCRFWMERPTAIRAFSSDVDTGSREEDASKQESRASFLILSEPKLSDTARPDRPREAAIAPAAPPRSARSRACPIACPAARR